VPFTLAHPAAALPFRRAAPDMLLPVALGCMAPDLPYFLPDALGGPIWHVGHHLVGSFTFSLPAGYALLVLLVLLRRVLVAPLWGPHRVVATRLFDEFLAGRAHWLRAVPAVLAGVWLHIAWDAFTHEYGVVIAFVPVLAANLDLGIRTIPVYRVLQYASSIVGLAALAGAWWDAARRVPVTTAAPHPRTWRPAAIAALMLGSAAAGAVELAASLRDQSSVYGHFTAFLTTSVAAFAVAWVATGAVLALRESRRV
jgi:hypothetical protein